MGVTCAIKGCHRHRGKIVAWKKSMCELHGELHDLCPCLIPYKLHKMPVREEARLQWLKAINREKLPNGVFVCSAHFLDGRPTVQNPYPRVNLGCNHVAKPAGRRKARTGRRKVRRESVEPSVAEENNQDMQDRGSTSIQHDSSHFGSFMGPTEPPVKLTASDSTQYCEADFNPGVVTDHSYASAHCHTFPKHPKDACTQTPITTTKHKGLQHSTPEVTAYTLLKTDHHSLFYTGVNRQVFFTLVGVLSSRNNFSFQMDVGSMLLIVLMRLRLHLPFEDLAFRFEMAKSVVCKIFNTVVPILAVQLKDLVRWLPRETIRERLPDSFKESCPGTTVIIDCAETFLQRPTILRNKLETQSNCITHNTVKYVVGISPHGLIMFISKAFDGRSSDKCLVESSGFLQYLKPGDELMSDRGLAIDDLLLPLRVKISVPSSKKLRKTRKSQLSAEEVNTTCVRVQVERAIRRLKMFKLLSSSMPVAALKSFDDVLLICAALVNLRGDLAKDPGDLDTD